MSDSYQIVPFGTKFRVQHTETGFIMRTLDTKAEAQAFAAAIAHDPKRRERS